MSTIKDVPNPPALFFSAEKFDEKNPNSALVAYIDRFLQTAATSFKGKIKVFAPKPGESDKDYMKKKGFTPSGKHTPPPKKKNVDRSIIKYSSIHYIRTDISEQVASQLSTTWHQRDPFNQFTPSNYPAGCVAIAIGQIMNYHRHGYLSGFYQSGGKLFESSFYGLKIDWNKLDKNDDMKGKVVASIGAGVGMDYGSDGSGATDGAALRYLRGRYPYARMIPYSFDVIKRQLDRKDSKGHRKVVYFTGGTKLKTWWCNTFGGPEFMCIDKGHAWVADGYKITATIGLKRNFNYYDEVISSGEVIIRKYRYIHMNWGWGGRNGWVSYDYILSPGKKPVHYNYCLEIIVDISH